MSSVIEDVDTRIEHLEEIFGKVTCMGNRAETCEKEAEWAVFCENDECGFMTPLCNDHKNRHSTAIITLLLVGATLSCQVCGGPVTKDFKNYIRKI